MTGFGIVGVGYVGNRLLQEAPGSLWLMSRSRDRCETWELAGHTSCCADLDEVDSLPPWIRSLDGIFYLAPPPAHGCEDRRMAVFLEWIAERPPKRIVYVSTTGVYGDCGGAWVDETSPINPGSDRARRRVDAEQRLQAFADCHDVQLVILRVPGIYGPGRLPLERIRRGDPVLCPEDAPWSNRIHVDDLVACCQAAMHPEAEPGVYNVADSAPSSMTDYLYAVADAAGLQRPPCVNLEEAPKVIGKGMMSYLRESRRISNTKMREQLGVRLRYPSLGEGLAELVRST